MPRSYPPLSNPLDSLDAPRPPNVTPGLTQAWGEWIAHQGPWHVFGALTYDQRRRPLDDQGYRVMPAELTTRQHVRRWLQNVSSVTHGRLEAAVVALEYQKNGWPHFHPLIRLSGDLQGREFEQLGQAWYRKHGYAQLAEPRSQTDVAEYAAKYLVKDLARGDVLFWPLRGPWPDRQAQLL